MDLILELFAFLPPRLFGFIIAVLFIFGGVWVWQQGSAERALYDNAVGAGSRKYNAEIRYKTTRSESSSGINDHDSGTHDVDYLTLSYEEENSKYGSVDVAVDRDDFNSVKVGDRINISFHPETPDYVVTTMKKRPGLTWYRIGGGAMALLGGIFIFMVLGSYFVD